MQRGHANSYRGSYAWKPGFQQLLRPAVRWLAAQKVSPNEISAAALGMSVLTGTGLLVSGGDRALWLALPVLLLLRMALNAMDGMLAREHGQLSNGGVYWNELGDLASDAFLLAPLALVDGVNAWMLAAAILSLALAEMAGIISQALTGKRAYAGLLGKSDRALLLAALAMVIGITGGLPLWVAHAVPVLITVLLVATIFIRIPTELPAPGGRHARR